jgi:hypothetical protein
MLRTEEEERGHGPANATINEPNDTRISNPHSAPNREENKRDFLCFATTLP